MGGWGMCYKKNITSQRQMCLKHELTICEVSFMLDSLVVNILLFLYKILCFQSIINTLITKINQENIMQTIKGNYISVRIG